MANSALYIPGVSPPPTGPSDSAPPPSDKELDNLMTGKYRQPTAPKPPTQAPPSKIPLTTGGSARTGSHFADAPRLARMTADIERDANRAGPDIPQYKPVPYKPEPLVQPKEFNKVVGMSLLFAAMASRHSGQPMVAALSAFTGAVQGSIQGRHEVVAQHLKEWEDKSKQAINAFQAESDHYRDILNDRKTRIDEKLRLVDIQARTIHDQQLINLKGNYQAILGVLKQRSTSIGQLNNQMSTLVRQATSANITSADRKRVTEQINAKQAEIKASTDRYQSELDRVDPAAIAGDTGGQDHAALIDQANAAIAGGADPAAVRARLQQMGVSLGG